MPGPGSMRLEIKPQSQLNKSWISYSAGNHPKSVGCIIACCGIKTRSGEPELRVIENIEELRSELNVGTLRDAGPLK
jgi:hypothetical protein